MEIIETVGGLRSAVEAWRSAGKSVGLVPTMGALHGGHLSLVRRALADNDGVVVSVFVNPTQFNNPDDLRTYPRDLAADARLLEGLGAGARLVVFAPSVAEVYPTPDTRQFDLGPVAAVMEGAHRPGHFNGVCQVVSKLLAFTHPDRAYFGEKDWQQIAVVRRMVSTECLQVDIVSCPICREADGLAISSRNVLLTPEHRAAAPKIHAALEASREHRDLAPRDLEQWTIEQIDREPLLRTEYFCIVDGHTLQPLEEWPGATYAVGCVTVQAGNVRLIDNITYVPC